MNHSKGFLVYSAPPAKVEPAVVVTTIELYTLKSAS